MNRSILIIAVITLLYHTFSVGGISNAAESNRPNILFAIADDWGQHGGAYGTTWVNTPALDRIAKEGVLFRNAFTPNAKCAPSRAIILTGRHSWQLEEAGNHMAYFPTKYRSFPEALASNGYYVGTTGKGWGPGEARDSGGKRREIVGKVFSKRKAKPPTTGIGDNDYAGNFSDFLATTSADQPWCFWYGAIEPHRGYEFGSGVAKAGKKLDQIERVPSYWPDNDIVRNDILDYALEVEYFDDHLSRMLAELEQRGLLENTLVIVTSDHGVPFPRGKGQAYLDSNKIPLAIRWPEVIKKPGRIIQDFVDFTDLAPTILDAAQVSQQKSGMAEITGQTLRPIFESEDSGQIIPSRDHVLVGKERHDVGRPNDVGYPIRGLIRNGFLFLQNFETDRWPAGNPETGYLNTDGGATKTNILENRRQHSSDIHWLLCFGKRPTFELYNIVDDPDCVTNLADLPEHATTLTTMREELKSKLLAQGDPRMIGNGDIFDRYPIATENLRGFYERFLEGKAPKAGWVNDSDFEKGPLK